MMSIQNDTRNFYENIRQIREKNHLSYEEMAKRLGISKKALLSIEDGILPPRLSCAILFRIQREFGVSPKDMFSTNT